MEIEDPAPRHQLGIALRIERLLARIAVSVRKKWCAVGGLVLVGGAQGVQQLVRNHHVVRALHARRRKCVHDPDQSLGEPERVRHHGRALRVVIQHEDANILGIGGVAAVAERPVTQLQGEQRGRESARVCIATGRHLMQGRTRPRFQRRIEAQVVARGLAHEEPVDIGEARALQSVDVVLGDRAVVGRNRIESDMERYSPASARPMIVPGLIGDDQQYREQYRDADPLEGAARGVRHQPGACASLTAGVLAGGSCD